MRRHDQPDLGAARVTEEDRLRAMRLRPARGGWVPEEASTADDRPATGPDPRVPGDRAVSPPAAGDLLRGWLQDRLPQWAHGAVERAGSAAVLAALVGVLALAVGAVALWHHRSATSSMASSYDASTTGVAGDAAPLTGAPVGPGAFPTPAAGMDTSSIVVDVGGKVRKPGLVTLPPGARVADAIAAAGGPLHHREVARLDLAARVSDGQLLLIGVDAPAAAGSGAAPVDGTAGPGATGSPAPVGLNAATLDQLETLPGIGPVLGQKIIDWRTAHNGFTSVAQLQQVSGIGPATYAELSALVTL